MSEPEIIELGGEHQSLRQQIGALQTDFSQLRTDLLALTKAIAELSKRRAENGVEGLKQAGNEAAARMRAAATEAATWKDAGLAATERHVVEHPVSSLLLAFAAGLIFGRLVERR